MVAHDIENEYHCDCRDPEGHMQWLYMKRENKRLRVALERIVDRLHYGGAHNRGHYLHSEWRTGHDALLDTQEEN